MTALNQQGLARTVEILQVDSVIEYVFGPDAVLRRDRIILVNQLCISDQITGSIWEQVPVASFWEYYVRRATSEIYRMLNESASDSARSPRT